MDAILAVDGGGSKTVALVCSLDGRVLGAGRAASADIPAIDPANPRREVDRAVAAACEEAGIGPADLRHAGFAVLVAVRPEDCERLRRAFVERGFGRDATVVLDVVGSLRAGTPNGTGMVLAAGTGMGIAAKRPSGEAWHSWPWPMPGGAMNLGQSALNAVFRAEIGGGPSTSLTGRVLEAFGLDSVEEVLLLIVSGSMTPYPPMQATLAPLVLDEAAAGDEVALRIVEGFGEMLGEYAAAIATRVGLGPDPFPIALSGGVFRHPSPIYENAVRASLERALPGNPVIRSRFQPVAGAAMLALEACGVEVTPAVLDTLEATMPPPTLFDSATPTWVTS